MIEEDTPSFSFPVGRTAHRSGYIINSNDPPWYLNRFNVPLHHEGTRWYIARVQRGWEPF